MRVAIIDADFIPYYVTHCKKLPDGTKEIKSLKDCKNATDNLINNIMINTEATHYIMAITVGKCFRYQVNSQYKSNRKYDDPPEHLSAIKWYLRSEYNGVFYEGLEADDIVNIINERSGLMSIDYDGENYESFIVSPDKDILNLAGKHYNPRKNEWVETSRKRAILYFWTSMITGDSADGIKGLPKKGIKYAEKLFSDPDKLTSEVSYSMLVLNEYIQNFGEELGIDEFYKNYKSLKILDKWEGFVIPEPVKFSLNR